MIRRLFAKLVDAREGEVLPSLLAVSLYFCIMFAYFILRPLRDAMGLDGGVDSLRVLFIVGLGVMVVANVAFGFVTSRLPRRVFIPLVYLFAIASLLGFYAYYSLHNGEGSRAVGNVFFVWLSVFNLFAVTVLWGFLADIFGLEQSKRLFGFVAVGGTAGAIAGSAYTGVFVDSIRADGLFASAIILLIFVVLIVFALDRIATSRGMVANPDRERPDAPSFGGRSLEGIRDVLTNPYLRTIALYVLIYTVVSTLLYFEKNRIVDSLTTTREERARMFAVIDVISQSSTIAVQLFLTGRLMRTVGVGRLLAVVPAVSVAGFVAITLAPGIVAVAIFEAIRKSSNYALSRPARETLYTVLSREEKYKAKSLIDTFVYRGGDSVGTLADLAIALVALPVAVLAIPLSIAGIALSALLGRAESRRAASDSYSHPAPADPPALAIEKG